MADLVQRPWPTVPLVAPTSTDQLVGLQIPGDINIRFPISELIGLSAGVVSNVLYWASNGNDTTGDGSFSKPFLTYEKARSTADALLPSATNVFNLIWLGGAQSIPLFRITPFVNVFGNGGTFNVTDFATDAGWLAAPGTWVFSDVVLATDFDFNSLTGGVTPHASTLVLNNIYSAGTINHTFIGLGSETVYISADSELSGFNFITANNFNVQILSNLSVSLLNSINTNVTVPTETFINADITGDILIQNIGAAVNVLKSRASVVSGSITISGTNSSWQYDVVSYKAPILSSGGAATAISVAQGLENPGHVIQINNGVLTPITMQPNRTYIAAVASPSPCQFVLSSAAVDGDYVEIIGTGGAGWGLVIGPGTSMIDQFGQTILSLNSINQYNSVKLYCKGFGNYQIVYSTMTPVYMSAELSGSFPVGPTGLTPILDVTVLDPYNGFDEGAGAYTIPGQVFETGVYKIRYRMSTSATDIGDYNINLLLDIDGGIYTNSIIPEQQDFNTIGGTLRRSFAGFVLIPLTGAQVVTAKIQNNGGINVNVDSAWMDIERIS